MTEAGATHVATRLHTTFSRHHILHNEIAMLPPGIAAVTVAERVRVPAAAGGPRLWRMLPRPPPMVRRWSSLEFVEPRVMRETAVIGWLHVVAPPRHRRTARGDIATTLQCAEGQALVRYRANL